jgi:hypothetical protein
VLTCKLFLGRDRRCGDSFNFIQSYSINIQFALGIVADSPEAGEPASLPRTMSGKPDGERSEPERPKKEYFIETLSQVNIDYAVASFFLLP